MIYIVYKTTNLINRKTYIGLHKQIGENFDGYYGSGILLRGAIKKYGIDNFIRETLFVFNDLESARDKERQIVTKEFCLSRDNYNISVGGTGGDTLAGYDDNHKQLIYEKIYDTNKANGSYIYSGEKLERARKRMLKNRTQPNNVGRIHRDDALFNMRMSSSKRNGKFVWITDGKFTMLIDKHEQIPEGYYLGRGSDVKKFTKHTDESRIKIAQKITGNICYNNGKKNLKLKRGEIPPEGYIRGMLQNHCSKWITNGSESKKIKKTESPPDGWMLGRTLLKRKM